MNVAAMCSLCKIVLAWGYSLQLKVVSNEVVEYFDHKYFRY